MARCGADCPPLPCPPRCLARPSALPDDDQLRLAAQSNDEDNFAHKFDPRLEAELMDRYAEFGPFLDRLFADEAMLGFFFAQMRKPIYEQLRAK